MRIAIINGPNLNEIGTREPEIYGSTSFEEAGHQWEELFPHTQIQLHQSNQEGILIDLIQRLKNEVDGLIINAGAYAHTSIAIADALRSVTIPMVEVHMPNIHARESYRKSSYMAEVVDAVIVGMGMQGYALAIQYLIFKD